MYQLVAQITFKLYIDLEDRSGRENTYVQNYNVHLECTYPSRDTPVSERFTQFTYVPNYNVHLECT